MHHQITPGAVVLTVDQIELTVRALEGNVAELEAADGSWYGYRHVSSLTLVCPPLPPTAPAQSLAAAADAGQGEGTNRIALADILMVSVAVVVFVVLSFVIDYYARPVAP